jgi:hypothetical protein
MITRSHAICRRKPQHCGKPFGAHDQETGDCPDGLGKFIKVDGEPAALVQPKLLPPPPYKPPPAAKLREVNSAAPPPAPVAPPKPVIVAAPPPKPKGARVSDSFGADELIAGDELFKTLLRGGDVRMLLRSEAARSLIQKFQTMRARSASKQSASASPGIAASSPTIHYAPGNGADTSTTHAGG